MSAAPASNAYDPVFDSQKHYRTLLNCTARPGTIGQLDDVGLDVPESLNRATALVTLALFSGDVSFFLQGGKAAALRFLGETGATPAASDQSDFLILEATDSDGALEALRLARSGSLSFPEAGATVILQVTAVSPAPLSDCLELTLTGPGIETRSTAFVSGVPTAMLELLRRRNREFPLGVDVIVTCNSLSAGPCMLSLPRTTSVDWKAV